MTAAGAAGKVEKVCWFLQCSESVVQAVQRGNVVCVPKTLLELIQCACHKKGNKRRHYELHCMI